MPTISDGIIIGGAGGAIAGITVWIIQYVHTKVVEKNEKKRVYKWLLKNTSKELGNQFRSTRAIASWNNLTEDRVRYICSIDERIYLSTGSNEGLWSIHERTQPSVYENRGITSL